MTKQLTTGEMIDTLKVGEIAEQHISDFTYRVRKESSGSIMCLDLEGNVTGHYLQLEGGILKNEWTIVPNYVSFSEAMKAVEEGKGVHCQFRDESITIKSYNNKISAICFEKHCVSGGGPGIKIAWIVAGKWTIVGDNQ